MVPVRPSDERGFTLVEMLVVVLIVAILAAIAVAILTNQRTKAQDAEAKTTATVVATALTIWHQDHDTYAGAGRDELAAIEPAIATARGLVVHGTADTYTISVASAAATAGGGPFEIEYRDETTTRSCRVPGRGGCPDSGGW
jgi:prepilin-type N-terminal cleavage/methylation domain-containing protein